MVDCFCDEQFPYSSSYGFTFTGLLVCDSLICCGGYININDDDDDDNSETYATPRKEDSPFVSDSHGSNISARSSVISPRDLTLSTTTTKVIDFTNFDPHMDYIRSYKTIALSNIKLKQFASSSNGNKENDHKSSTLSLDRTSLTDNQEMLLASARKLDRHQKDENMRKIDISRCLSKYETLLSTDIQNMTSKEGILAEYEQCKHLYDADNEEDLIQLSIYLQAARNKHTTFYSDEKRVELYQKAIQYANNLTKKKEI